MNKTLFLALIRNSESLIRERFNLKRDFSMKPENRRLSQNQKFMIIWKNHERLSTDNTDNLTILNAFDNCINIEKNNYRGQMFDAETMRKMCENVELEVYEKMAPETFFQN